MPHAVEGECRNTGRTYLKKGNTPWNKGLKGVSRLHEPRPPQKRTPWNKGKTGIYSEDRKRKLAEAASKRFKGVKFTDEHKQKISESHKKNPKTEWCYNQWMAAFPGILVTALRDAAYGGNPYNNYPWQKMRKFIYERDLYMCQECGCQCDEKTGIACHHIDFIRENNDSMNLITLCSSCHGKTTQKPDEWIQYYQDKMLLKNKLVETSQDAERVRL